MEVPTKPESAVLSSDSCVCARCLHGQWPAIEDLNLACNRLWTLPGTVDTPHDEDQNAVAPIMTAPWVGLKKLDLTETGLFALSKPTLESWSMLEALSLNNNKTYGDVMHTLVRAHLPSLRGLSPCRGSSRTP